MLASHQCDIPSGRLRLRQRLACPCNQMVNSAVGASPTRLLWVSLQKDVVQRKRADHVPEKRHPFHTRPQRHGDIRAHGAIIPRHSRVHRDAREGKVRQLAVSRRALSSTSRIVLLAVLYFAAGKLSLVLAIPPGYATAVWPPSGFALAALLL